MPTVPVEMTAKEVEALTLLSAQTEMRPSRVMVQALRLYQLVHERMRAGETMSFSGDALRAAEFMGLDDGTCISCRGTGRYGGMYGPAGQPICAECNGTGKTRDRQPMFAPPENNVYCCQCGKHYPVEPDRCDCGCCGFQRKPRERKFWERSDSSREIQGTP